MIIQHPDGSYEVCALPPEIARWARALLRRVRGADAPQTCAGEPASCCEEEPPRWIEDRC